MWGPAHRVATGSSAGQLRAPSHRYDPQLHAAVALRLLGGSEALWTGLELSALGYRCTEHVPTPHATHVALARRA
jgi:hypothetical protein